MTAADRADGREEGDVMSETVEVPGREAVEVLQAATDRMAGVPFTVLAGHGDVPAVLGRAWVNGACDVLGLALAVQQRAIDQALAVQQQLVAGLVDAGCALTGTAPGGPRDPSAARR